MDIARQNLNFLIPHKDHEYLADRIIYLLQNPDKAKDMGRYGYNRAITEFVMENWVNKIISFYETVFAENVI